MSITPWIIKQADADNDADKKKTFYGLHGVDKEKINSLIQFVTMESFNFAKTCELVGLYLISSTIHVPVCKSWDSIQMMD